MNLKTHLFQLKQKSWNAPFVPNCFLWKNWLIMQHIVVFFCYAWSVLVILLEHERADDECLDGSTEEDSICIICKAAVPADEM